MGEEGAITIKLSEVLSGAHLSCRKKGGGKRKVQRRQEGKRGGGTGMA